MWMVLVVGIGLLAPAMAQEPPQIVVFDSSIVFDKSQQGEVLKAEIERLRDRKVQLISERQDGLASILFYDAGNAWTNKQGYDLSDLRMDVGIEVRFYLPVFGAPLRLIYGWNLDPEDFEDKQDFIFSIGL